MELSKLRLGIIGCGAIAENSHLPAALSSSLVDLVAICDANESRLRYIQRQFGLDRVIAVSDYRQLCGVVDAVILALPNRLHAPIGCELLSQGIHVLCEKPLATSRKECEQLCSSARKTHSVLAVGYYSRHYPSTELVRALIRSRFLGRLQSFDYEYGNAGGWETLSGYNLTRKDCGGGVLVVSGSHFLDRLLYFFDAVSVAGYADDCRGGVDANCVVILECNANEDAVGGRVTLSRTHKLANRMRIVGQRGVLEIAEGQNNSVTFYPAEGGIRHDLSYLNGEPSINGENAFEMELEDFIRAVKNGTQPKTSGEQSIPLATIFEKCYECVTALEERWVDETIPLLRRALPAGESARMPLAR